VRENYLRASIYDVEWQILRVSLLARNNDWGGFGNVWGCTTNFQLLRKYVLGTTNLFERYLRYNRVANLLSATLYGYGSRPKLAECAKMVRTELEAYQSGMSSTHAMEAKRQILTMDWDWKKVEEDLKTLYLSGYDGETKWLQIWDSLKERVRISNKKPAKMLHRPELNRFIELMKTIDIDL
jgi:hypothetical protein